MMPNYRRMGVACGLLLLAISAGGAGKSIDWQKDLAKAQAIAAKQHKILMVDFYADW